MAIEYPDDNTPMIPELRPNRDLIKIRETFGVDPRFLLSDKNQYYTNMNDDQPIEKIDDGVKKYIMAGGDGGGITELLGSQDGAIGYVRPLDSIDGTGITGIDSKFDQYKNYKYTDQDYIDQINAMRRTNPNFNSYTDQDLVKLVFKEFFRDISLNLFLTLLFSAPNGDNILLRFLGPNILIISRAELETFPNVGDSQVSAKPLGIPSTQLYIPNAKSSIMKFDLSTQFCTLRCLISESVIGLLSW